jgi:hypothetical protein
MSQTQIPQDLCGLISNFSVECKSYPGKGKISLYIYGLTVKNINFVHAEFTNQNAVISLDWRPGDLVLGAVANVLMLSVQKNGASEPSLMLVLEDAVFTYEQMKQGGRLKIEYKNAKLPTIPA